MWSNLCLKNFTNFWPVPTSQSWNILLTFQFQGSCWFHHNEQIQRLIHVSNLNLAGYFHLNVGLISLKIDLLSVILLHSEFKLEELLRIIQLYYKKNWMFTIFWLTLFWIVTLLRGGIFKLLPRRRQISAFFWANSWTSMTSY